MSKVVFSGHGGFETATDPPWVTVPDGTTIYFYSDNMKALLDSNGQTVETMAAALDSASPSQVVYSGQSCPNYTLYPPDGLDIMDSPDDVEQVIVGGDETLESLLTQYSGEIYWAACRVVDLNEVGGQYLGVNDSQYELGGNDSSGPDSERMDTWLAWWAQADDAARWESWGRKDENFKQGARLNDETLRQWEAQAYNGTLNTGEMDGFLEWWGTAEQSERDQAWGDLTAEQQEQVRERYADTTP